MRKARSAILLDLLLGGRVRPQVQVDGDEAAKIPDVGQRLAQGPGLVGADESVAAASLLLAVELSGAARPLAAAAPR